MKIRYIEPLSRAVERATDICFRPFDLGKWFVLGFACWLARLTEGGGGGFSVPTPPVSDREAEGAVAEGPWELFESFDPEMALGGAVLAGVIGCLVLFFLVLLPLLLWLSSRGQFMFLDGVVHDRARIKEPWKEFRTEGNSLFLWRLGFIGVVILVLVLAVTPLIIYVVRQGPDVTPSVPAILVMVLPVILIAFAIAYVDMWLRSFVVPIMYKERLKATAAWRRFLPHLKERLGSFLLYGLWLVVLMIGLGIGLLILVLVTCCIAGILLIIPYIGTVLLLPVYVALRSLSLEYLAQFSDEFRIFPAPGGGEPLAAAAGGGTLPPPEPPPPPSTGTFEPEV